jgi:hypothetical protein
VKDRPCRGPEGFRVERINTVTGEDDGPDTRGIGATNHGAGVPGVANLVEDQNGAVGGHVVKGGHREAGRRQDGLRRLRIGHLEQGAFVQLKHSHAGQLGSLNRGATVSVTKRPRLHIDGLDFKARFERGVNSWTTSLTLAATNLWAQKTRTVLTALGIIFGVGAVIGMLAIGAGAREESMRFIETLGVRNLLIEARPASSDQELQQRRRQVLGW